MAVEQFNLPLPPQGLVFPENPQLVASVAMQTLAGAFLIYALYQWARTRSPLAPLLLLGGAVCYLNEPLVDVLGLCWHPRPGQWVALHTFGPAPLWGLGIYIVFFGGLTHVLLRQAQRGITRRQFWIGVLAFFIADLLCELPLIHYGLYRYYGDPPFQVAGFPLFWLFINTPGPLIDVALLLAAPRFFSGWRLILVPLLPMTTDAAGSVAAGWPIFSALNTPGAPALLKMLAALLTGAIGLTLMNLASQFICRPPPSRFPGGAVAAAL